MRSMFGVGGVWILLAALLCLVRGVRAEGNAPELRGFWADGFNEGYKTPAQVDLLLQRLRQAHCNAVFAQMRKGGDAYYASHYEPWAHDDPTHFDALADLIRKAHALRPPIAVHAWLNVCAVGNNRYHLPGHIATTHPDWLSLNTRLQAADPEVAKIDPGDPDAADWTFRVFMDVVRHYDIDGIHLDFVRYSGKRRGYNPVNVARYLSRFPARIASARRSVPTKTRSSESTAAGLLAIGGSGTSGTGVRLPAQTGADVHPLHSVAASTVSSAERSITSQPQGAQTEPPARVPSGDSIGGRTLPASTALPDPDDPNWKQWRRDQVTAFVRKLYAHAVAIKPKIVVSAALIAWQDGPHSEEEWNKKSAAMNLVFQDWRSWMQEGILDLGCPMTYFQARRALRQAADWYNWTKAHQYGRIAAPSIGCWENTIPETLALLSLARRADAVGRRPGGVLFYSYAGTNESPPDARGRRKELQLQPEFYAALGQPSPYARTPPFPTDVPPPPMPWKDHPTCGVLKGFVLTSDLHPIDGALVELHAPTGRMRRCRTDGTGFYAFIDLPEEVKREEGRVNGASQRAVPWEKRQTDKREEASRDGYMMRVTGPGGETARAKAVVTAGQATTVSFNLGKSDIVPLTSVADLLNQPVFATAIRPGRTLKPTSTAPSSFRVAALLVTLGTDTDPGTLYGVDHNSVGVRVRLASPPVAPLQPGDVVSVVGTPALVEGEPTLDGATACLTDIAPSPSLPTPVIARAQDIALGRMGVGETACVRGRVTASDANGFTLEDGGVSIRVPLAGRKEFSIESIALDTVPLPERARAQVTGIVSLAMDGARKPILRILPRSGADVVMLAPPPFAPLAWASRVVLILVVLILAIGITAFLVARMRRRQPQ